MGILRSCHSRTVILLSLASLAAVLLTGCMRVERALVIYGDGSGSYTLTIGVTGNVSIITKCQRHTRGR